MEEISWSFFKKKMATALTSTILIQIFSNANFSYVKVYTTGGSIKER